MKNSNIHSKVILLRFRCPAVLTQHSLLPSALCQEERRQHSQGLLAWPQRDLLAGGSGSRPRGPRASGLCLNHTGRPRPGPGPGETGLGPPSTCRVCQLRKNLNSAKVVTMSVHSPGSLTSCNPRVEGVIISTRLFFPLGLLDSATSQTSYHMLTGYFTVF